MAKSVNMKGDLHDGTGEQCVAPNCEMAKRIDEVAAMFGAVRIGLGQTRSVFGKAVSRFVRCLRKPTGSSAPRFLKPDLDAAQRGVASQRCAIIREARSGGIRHPARRPTHCHEQGRGDVGRVLRTRCANAFVRGVLPFPFGRISRLCLGANPELSGHQSSDGAAFFVQLQSRRVENE